MQAPKVSVLERVDGIVSFIQVQMWHKLYITHQACQENSPGMPGKIYGMSKNMAALLDLLDKNGRHTCTSPYMFRLNVFN